jgi:hypothetical protein
MIGTYGAYNITYGHHAVQAVHTLMLVAAVAVMNAVIMGVWAP